MRIKVIREKFHQHEQSHKRFRSEPKWLIILGLGLTTFSILAWFAAQVIFAVLAGVGGLIVAWGVIQWVLHLFEKK